MPLFDEMITRTLAEHPEMNEEKPAFDLGLPKVPAQSEMNPMLAALIASGVDGASTYNFMKKGQGTEDNAMLGGMGPMGTALGAAGSGLAGIAASKLIKKFSPKLADALLANQGAQQLAIGTQNFARPVNGQSSVQTINNGIGKEITGN